MPRSRPAPHATNRTTARPSTRVPGPGNPVEDALLKARQSVLNTEPFTAEHYAAYAAFCGISDRRTALDLHRHKVTWDDVNDYSSIAGIASTDFATMKALKQAGVGPSLYRAWQDIATNHNVTVSVSDAITYTTAQVLPAQTVPYYAIRVSWRANDIIQFIHARLSPDEARAWLNVHITNASQAVALHTFGCEPRTVTAFARMRRLPAHYISWQFKQAYDGLRRATGDPGLAEAALLNGLTPHEARAWAQIAVPSERARQYINAGVSADEWHNDPTVRDVDAATLDTLAALNQTDYALVSA